MYSPIQFNVIKLFSDLFYCITSKINNQQYQRVKIWVFKFNSKLNEFLLIACVIQFKGHNGIDVYNLFLD